MSERPRKLAEQIATDVMGMSRNRIGLIMVIIVDETAEGLLEADACTRAGSSRSEQGGTMIEAFGSKANEAIRKALREVAAASGGYTVDRTKEISQ